MAVSDTDGIIRDLVLFTALTEREWWWSLSSLINFDVDESEKSKNLIE